MRTKKEHSTIEIILTENGYDNTLWADEAAVYLGISLVHYLQEQIGIRSLQQKMVLK